MCGGPAHGTWRVLEPWEKTVDVLAPVQIRWTPEPVDPNSPALKRITYRIMPLVILGHELFVGVATDEAYDDCAILKAVLQRDVAQHLGVYR